MREQDIEIWFERKVNSLDRLFMNSDMSDESYCVEMEKLKQHLEKMYAVVL